MNDAPIPHRANRHRLGLVAAALLAFGLLTSGALAQEHVTEWEYATLVVDTLHRQVVIWDAPGSDLDDVSGSYRDMIRVSDAVTELGEQHDREDCVSGDSFGSLLNMLGCMGWELIAADEGRYILKRPAQ